MEPKIYSIFWAVLGTRGYVKRFETYESAYAEAVRLVTKYPSDDIVILQAKERITAKPVNPVRRITLN